MYHKFVANCPDDDIIKYWTDFKIQKILMIVALRKYYVVGVST
jgi:hypothetical protein